MVSKRVRLAGCSSEDILGLCVVNRMVYMNCDCKKIYLTMDNKTIGPFATTEILRNLDVS